MLKHNKKIFQHNKEEGCCCNFDPRTSGGMIYVSCGIEKPNVTYVTNPEDMGWPPSDAVRLWLTTPAAANDRLVCIDTVTGEVTGQAVLSTDTSIPVPINGQNNEPHHIGFINNGKGVIFGGLLSIINNVLTGNSYVNSFKIDITDPTNPFYFGGDAVHGSATDEYYQTTNGEYLLTMMGSPEALSPGNVTVFDKSNNILGNFSGGMTVDDQFYPHGITYDPNSDTLITSDFAQPLAAVVGTKTGPIIFGKSVRVWRNFYQKVRTSVPTVDQTITVPVGRDVDGFMSVLIIPGNSKQWAYACGRGKLYLIKSDLGIMVKVLGLPSALAGYITMNRGGTRLVVPMMEDVGYVDITDPERPVLVDVVSLKKYQCGDYQWRIPMGSHYNKYSLDEKYVYNTDYFISTPVIQDMGDRKLWRAIIGCDMFCNDHSFEFDFNIDLKSNETDLQQRGIPMGTTLPGHPHGILIGEATAKQSAEATHILPISECRSPSRLQYISKCKLKEVLLMSIESWLVNATSAMALAKEISSVPTEIPYPQYRSLINSCNAIGVCYGKIYGKEFGAEIIKKCFYVSTQYERYIEDIFDNAFGAFVDPEYNLALLYKRSEGMANVFSVIFNTEYDETLEKVNEYISSLVKWVNGLKQGLINSNPIIPAYNLALFLACNIFNIYGPNYKYKSKYNGLSIFSYCAWINLGYYELAYKSAEKICKKYFEHDKYAPKALKNLVTAYQKGSNELIMSSTIVVAKILYELPKAATITDITKELASLIVLDAVEDEDNNSETVQFSAMTNGHAIELIRLLGLNK
jgi:hypothetical protein